MLNMGTIVGGAFGLLRDRFGAVLIWGLLYTLAAFALGYLIIAWMGPMIPVDETADPAVALGAMGGLLGRMILLYFGFFCIYMVLLTAAQRAVLRPEESGFAALRFGGDELRAIGLGIVVGIIFFIVYLVSVLILIILVGVGAGGGGVAGLGIAAILGIIAIFCLMLLLWARLSLAFPLTLLRGRIVLGEAWRLSRGHSWTLFFGYLVLILAVFAITIAGSAILQGGYWAELLQSGGMIDPAVQQAQIDAQFSFGPAMLLSLAFGAIAGGLMIALTGGAIASAAKALDADHEGMARTFS